jgi:hypothetical protein
VWDPSGHDGLEEELATTGIDASLSSTLLTGVSIIAKRALVGAVIGGIYGAIDAYTGGGDANAIIQEAEQGAENGAAIGVIFPSLNVGVRLAVIIYSTYQGVSSSLNNNLPDQALFRFGAGAIFLGMSVPNAPVETTINTLSRLAGEATENVGPPEAGQTPQQMGTAIHSQFASLIAQEGVTGVSTEISYKGGRVVRYGTAGSVRADVVEGDVNNPTAIYDLKTGNTGLTPAEVANYRANLPVGSRSIPVVEIRKP